MVILHSIIKLTENSKIVIDEYIYDSDPTKSKLALNMASGTARFITGALGKIDKRKLIKNVITNLLLFSLRFFCG